MFVARYQIPSTIWDFEIEKASMKKVTGGEHGKVKEVAAVHRLSFANPCGPVDI